MLYFFFVHGIDQATPWIHEINVFRYISFRAGGALMTSLLIFFMLGSHAIDFLRARQGRGQPIRDDGPEGHLIEKRGTPTMGGVIIVGALLISTLLWARLDTPHVWIVMFVTLGFSLIGFADDLAKVRKHTTAGLSSKMRLFLGGMIALIATLLFSYASPEDLQFKLSLPGLKDTLLDLWWFFVPFGMVVIVGAANAVNLTDGLDGLAIVPAMIAAVCFGIISHFVGNSVFSSYLQLNFVPGTGQLAVFCAALIGSGLGFLWYNAPPAMIFMGDTGSLALGGALGAISVATKHEIVLSIIGGLFVAETLSVIIQVLYYKKTGKRVFLMAPFHHHFEKKGWKEPTIVIRFWIIAVILGLIGLATLKLR